MKKRILGIVIAVVVLINASMGVFAADANGNEVQPRTMDAVTTVSLTISSGVATSKCTVIGSSDDVTKISITMTLQKKAGSGKFYAVNTWTGTKSDSTYTLKKTADISKGTYRVMAKVTCYEGSTSETIYKYSGTKTY